MKKFFALFFCLFAFWFFALLFLYKKDASKNLLDRAKAKGELTIATEGSWIPWSYKNDSGELLGFDVEIAKIICGRLGVRARFVPMEWERILPSVELGICDMAINGIGVTEERKKEFYFTMPYSYTRTVLIVRKDNDRILSFEDLRGKTCANALGSVYEKMAQERGAIAIVIDSFDESIQLLLQNRVESTLNSDFSFYHYMKANPGAEIKAAAFSDGATSVAIGLKKSDESLSLLNELNRILSEMHSDGSLSELALKYFEKDTTK